MLIKNNITGETTEVADVNIEVLPLTDEQKAQMYKDAVIARIREKYTVDDEQAILRKKLAGLDDGEFEVFNAYAEECKAKTRLELEGLINV